MRFKKGAYETANYTVLLKSFSVEPLYGGYGDRPYAYRKRLSVQGFLEGTSQSDLDTKIATLEAAMSAPDQSVQFLRTNGVATQHSLDYLTSTNGVRLTAFGYESGVGGEFATYRTWNADFEAEYANGYEYSQIMEYSQTVTYEGGLPRQEIVETLTGQPSKFLVGRYSAFKATEQGTAVGRTGYPTVPAALYPDDLTSESVSRGLANVIKFDAQSGGVFRQGYSVQWSREYAAVSQFSLWP